MKNKNMLFKYQMSLSLFKVVTFDKISTNIVVLKCLNLFFIFILNPHTFKVKSQRTV